MNPECFQDSSTPTETQKALLNNSILRNAARGTSRHIFFPRLPTEQTLTTEISPPGITNTKPPAFWAHPTRVASAYSAVAIFVGYTVPDTNRIAWRQRYEVQVPGLYSSQRISRRSNLRSQPRRPIHQKPSDPNESKHPSPSVSTSRHVATGRRVDKHSFTAPA